MTTTGPGRRIRAHGRPLTAEERLFALESYEAGEKLVVVAHLLNCTESAVCKIAARDGATMRRPRGKWRTS